MSNTIATLQEIARQALPQLIENLVFPTLCYRDFSEDFHDLGDTVKVRRPCVFTAEEFDAENGVNYQDLLDDTVDVSLDHIATVDARASAIESATGIEDLNRIFIGPAVAALAEKINADGLQLYKDIAAHTGTAGTAPGELADLAAVRRMMNLNRVPATGRVAVWDPEADARFAQLNALVNAEKAGSTEALREGSIGRVYGLDNYMSQSVCRHKVGSAISGGCTLKVNAAAKAGDMQIAISGGAGNVAVVDGVKAEHAKGAAVNYVGGAAQAEYTCNLAFHPMAFAYVTRPLINPDGQGVASYVTNFNGISLRVTKGYDQRFKRSIYSMDVLYGYKTVHPQLAVRALG